MKSNCCCVNNSNQNVFGNITKKVNEYYNYFIIISLLNYNCVNTSDHTYHKAHTPSSKFLFYFHYPTDQLSNKKTNLKLLQSPNYL